MENASKALIMGASILLAIMIVSVGVALYTSFSEYGHSTINQLEEAKITEFNNKYTKYYGMTAEYNEQKKQYINRPIEVTAHDIVSVANLSKENNEYYELNKNYAGNENSYYVQVVVKYNKNKSEQNFETLTEEQKNQFLKENSLTEIKNSQGITTTVETKYYKCEEVKISSITKRVMKIVFSLYED